MQVPILYAISSPHEHSQLNRLRNICLGEANQLRLARLTRRSPGRASLLLRYRAQDTVAGLRQHIAAVELLFTEVLSRRTLIGYRRCHLRHPRQSRESPAKPQPARQKLVAGAIRLPHAQRSYHPRPAPHLRHPHAHALHRHFAQLATIVRQHGITSNWQMDYPGTIITPAKS